MPDSEEYFIIDTENLVLVGSGQTKTQLCVECFLRKPIEQFEDAGATCTDCRNER